MAIPDNPRLIAQLVEIYEASAERLRQIVIAPSGNTESGREFNQSRASVQLARVEAEIARLKRDATSWTSTAMNDAVRRGQRVADAQARAAGVKTASSAVQGGFNAVSTGAVEVIARDTLGDLHKAADSMGRASSSLLRRMAATGVTNAQVNAILAGRHVIEGQPAAAVRELRQALEAVHGKTVVIQGKNGPIEFKTGYYARMVATTKTRQAVVLANGDRLQKHGIDLVRIVGRVSVHFCTAFLGHVYSLSGSSDRYPPLARLPSGGPPFHPNCSKSTAPFIEGLSTADA